jgi:hypothetical protein
MTGPGAGDQCPEDSPGPPRGRRHRRVDAPPTNPEADPADDVPAAPGRPRADGAKGVPADARDAWIRAQRPPHWD